MPYVMEVDLGIHSFRSQARHDLSFVLAHAQALANAHEITVSIINGGSTPDATDTYLGVCTPYAHDFAEHGVCIFCNAGINDDVPAMCPVTDETTRAERHRKAYGDLVATVPEVTP
jgi:hypothetical protein